jgi:hypothetical protein
MRPSYDRQPSRCVQILGVWPEAHLTALCVLAIARPAERTTRHAITRNSPPGNGRLAAPFLPCGEPRAAFEASSSLLNCGRSCSLSTAASRGKSNPMQFVQSRLHRSNIARRRNYLHLSRRRFYRQRRLPHAYVRDRRQHCVGDRGASAGGWCGAYLALIIG